MPRLIRLIVSDMSTILPFCFGTCNSPLMERWKNVQMSHSYTIQIEIKKIQ